MIRRAPAVLTICAIAAAGCGDGGGSLAERDLRAGAGGLDKTDPESVAQAWHRTWWDCGEPGAGLRYDLSTSPNRDWTRATYLRLEREDACRRGQAPAVDPQLVDPYPEDEATRVVLRGRHILLPIILVRDASGHWKVDTSVSPTPPGRPS